MDKGGSSFNPLLDCVAGTKTAARLFPEDTSDRNAAAVKSGSSRLKGAQGEEEDPTQHEKHQLPAVPS